MKRPRTPTLRCPLPTLPAPWSWSGPDPEGALALCRDQRPVHLFQVEHLDWSAMVNALRARSIPIVVVRGSFRAFVQGVIKSPPRDWSNDDWNRLISACRSGRRRRTMKAERVRLRVLRPGRPAPSPSHDNRR